MATKDKKKLPDELLKQLSTDYGGKVRPQKDGRWIELFRVRGPMNLDEAIIAAYEDWGEVRERGSVAEAIRKNVRVGNLLKDDEGKYHYVEKT